MPARVNTEGDIGNALIKSDAYDVDNIFLTDEGWVYRHYKNDALTKFWDEIIVAGEVVPGISIGGIANNPVDAINDPAPTFQPGGDGDKDVENSPNFGGGGGSPTPPSPTLTGTTLAGDTTATDGDIKTYTATPAGTATDVTHDLASSNGSDVVSGLQVTFNSTGARTLTLTSTSVSASKSVTDTMNVTVS